MAPQEMLRSRDSCLGEEAKNRKAALGAGAEPLRTQTRNYPLQLLCDSIWQTNGKGDPIHTHQDSNSLPSVSRRSWCPSLTASKGYSEHNPHGQSPQSSTPEFSLNSAWKLDMETRQSLYKSLQRNYLLKVHQGPSLVESAGLELAEHTSCRTGSEDSRRTLWKRCRYCSYTLRYSLSLSMMRTFLTIFLTGQNMWLSSPQCSLATAAACHLSLPVECLECTCSNVTAPQKHLDCSRLSHTDTGRVPCTEHTASFFPPLLSALSPNATGTFSPPALSTSASLHRAVRVPGSLMNSSHKAGVALLQASRMG